MEDSILKTIKGLLDIGEVDHFNDNVAIGINTIFMEVCQLGVGPDKPFIITDNNATWSDFFGEHTDVEAVKSYIFMSVKLMFDPPSTSYAIASMERTVERLAYRLNTQVEYVREEE